jgi:hypothetical protein
MGARQRSERKAKIERIVEFRGVGVLRTARSTADINL